MTDERLLKHQTLTQLSLDHDQPRFDCDVSPVQEAFLFTALLSDFLRDSPLFELFNQRACLRLLRIQYL